MSWASPPAWRTPWWRTCSTQSRWRCSRAPSPARARHRGHRAPLSCAAGGALGLFKGERAAAGTRPSADQLRVVQPVQAVAGEARAVRRPRVFSSGPERRRRRLRVGDDEAFRRGCRAEIAARALLWVLLSGVAGTDRPLPGAAFRRQYSARGGYLQNLRMMDSRGSREVWRHHAPRDPGNALFFVVYETSEITLRRLGQRNGAANHARTETRTWRRVARP